MSAVLTPKKTERGWVIDIPGEMAQALSVADGTLALLYAVSGAIKVDVLPPPSPELIASVLEGCDEFDEAYREMKRRGD
ncbi:MAG: hypothetical protein M3X11_11325 [Acidobacteriota bacterium]|nr:hypothetical protein [Acidobacteriota bacterium]